MNTEMQERADRLVRNEVYVCLSSLVSTLAQGYDTGGSKDLCALCEQAFELCTPVPDWEEAARDAGWEAFADKFGVPCWRDTNDGATWAGTAEDVCREHNIDPYEWEIYEHWSVSQHLANDLAELGERVDTDFAGMCVWGRTTTGQGIAQDAIIADVLALHDARYKQAVA